jgi:hypothetical protein
MDASRCESLTEVPWEAATKSSIHTVGEASDSRSSPPTTHLYMHNDTTQRYEQKFRPNSHLHDKLERLSEHCSISCGENGEQ